MFDAALASDNPAVQKALRNFMMVAAIVHAQEIEEAERQAGPFETLIKKVSDLERMYWELKNTTTINNSNRYWRDAHLQNATWVYNPVTSVTSTSSSTTATSTTKPSTTYMGKDLNINDIYTYLKDIDIT